MRQHRTKTFSIMPWRVPVAAEDIAENGEHFALVADAETRAEIASMAGLRDLPCLQADFEVTRQGGGLHVVGRISATVGQTCVVTLEPVANRVEEDIDLVFLPQPAVVQGSGDDAKSASRASAVWDEPEPLVGGIVDLGALATEFLILGIDPYPRKPGAVFEAPTNRDRDAGPFAPLAEWTKGQDDR
jgi:hypothetical protein